MLKTLFTAVTLALAPVVTLAGAPLGEDGLHKAEWLNDTFLDMTEDLADATAEGKRLAIIVEQRGCIYCTKMYEEIFPIPEIDALMSDEYYFVQINMFGDLEVTDFDGETLAEREMVKKWGVFFTPTILFVDTEISAPGEAIVAVMPGAFGEFMTTNMLNWVLLEGYNTDEHFQKYHARMLETQLNQ